MNYKKSLAVIMVGSVLALTGCAGGDRADVAEADKKVGELIEKTAEENKTEGNPSVAGDKSRLDAKTSPIGTQAKAGAWKFRVNSVAEFANDGAADSLTRTIAVATDVTYAGKAASASALTGASWLFSGSDGKVYTGVVEVEPAGAASEEAAENVKPGSAVELRISFVVPADAAADGVLSAVADKSPQGVEFADFDLS